MKENDERLVAKFQHCFGTNDRSGTKIVSSMVVISLVL